MYYLAILKHVSQFTKTVFPRGYNHMTIETSVYCLNKWESILLFLLFYKCYVLSRASLGPKL